MLVLLTNGWRRRAAAFAVAVFALCLVAPVAVYAAGDSPMPAHCLSLADDHMAMGEHSHRHHGTEQGQSAPGEHEHGLPDKCCGLFSVTAIAPALYFVAEPPFHVSDLAVASATSLLGRGSSRIDRPPRLLPSL